MLGVPQYSDCCRKDHAVKVAHGCTRGFGSAGEALPGMLDLGKDRENMKGGGRSRICLVDTRFA